MGVSAPSLHGESLIHMYMYMYVWDFRILVKHPLCVGWFRACLTHVHVCVCCPCYIEGTCICMSVALYM